MAIGSKSPGFYPAIISQSKIAPETLNPLHHRRPAWLTGDQLALPLLDRGQSLARLLHAIADEGDHARLTRGQPERRGVRALHAECTQAVVRHQDLHSL